MKQLLLVPSILLCMGSFSQTTVFEEDFETTLDPFFQLNTDDLNGYTSSLTEWVVNDFYTGGPILITNYSLPFPMEDSIPDTPDQPSGISSGPNSFYLHMSQQLANQQAVMNASYIWTSDTWNVEVPSLGTSYFTRTQGINAMDMTDVTLSFWWLGGVSPSYGEIYYSVDAGNNWTLIATDFGDQSDWTEYTISDPAWDNLSTSIWFGFRYVIVDGNTPGGGYIDTDNGFSIDDIKVTGNDNSTNNIDKNEEQSITVYPNPASSQLTIKTDEEITEILIYDMFGSLVQTEIESSFSIENLADGIYTMTIKTQNGILHKRFIKE